MRAETNIHRDRSTKKRTLLALDLAALKLLLTIASKFLRVNHAC
jgi:hypothetical protein